MALFVAILFRSACSTFSYALRLAVLGTYVDLACAAASQTALYRRANLSHCDHASSRASKSQLLNFRLHSRQLPSSSTSFILESVAQQSASYRLVRGKVRLLWRCKLPDCGCMLASFRLQPSPILRAISKYRPYYCTKICVRQLSSNMGSTTGQESEWVSTSCSV